MKVSLLNLVAPDLRTDVGRFVEQVVAHARLADGHPFHRYWLGEHHTWLGDCIPAVLIQAVAAATRSLRVGSGGVLAQYANPRQLFEHYALLGAMYPGRIDLGVCNGLAGPEVHAQLDLPGRDRGWLQHLLEHLARHERTGLYGQLPGAHTPQVWVLGSGGRSHTLALRNGLRYCHSLFHAHPSVSRDVPISLVDGRRMESCDAIAVAGVCAATEASAMRELERHRSDFIIPLVAGTAQSCLETLADMAGEHGAQEVIFLDVSGTQDARLESVQLMGEALTARRRLAPGIGGYRRACRHLNLAPHTGKKMVKKDKLGLRKSSLRVLNDAEIDHVVGGAGKGSGSITVTTTLITNIGCGPSPSPAPASNTCPSGGCPSAGCPSQTCPSAGCPVTYGCASNTCQCGSNACGGGGGGGSVGGDPSYPGDPEPTPGDGDDDE